MANLFIQILMNVRLDEHNVVLTKMKGEPRRGVGLR